MYFNRKTGFLLYNTGADQEILKMGGALCRPPWLAGDENYKFQMV